MKGSVRIWAAGCVLAAVAIVGGGYALGVQPQLAHAAEADAATANVETQISASQTKLASLAKLAATQSQMEQRSGVLAKAVPSALQANTFSRRMNTVAALDGVEVVSWASGEATAYTPPKAAVTTSAATTTTSTTTGASAAPVAAPAASAAPVLAATDPLITGANLTVIPTTIVIKGTADAGMQFVKDMQNDERLFLVSGYSAAVDADDASSVTTTLTGSIYALKS